ncbi:LacI family DNA-binding transcriptional regulator [Spirosoma utsteinense]|uniref:LacI family transcriptional regulator n=1 Tax=Spirosoma utsteinense TaxID=2585773 RepID=A0ABR6WEW0_9BACT|nr:LacI family DNA-binding transcriptional regulator [Spirosoma utsteinense]MBC3787435.1 LacI family transcriptional regulator [Spirosoma utsteinense]MBC3794545.1 LacI family transcriptional regulator [Spirosoma utsteinense]
MEKDVTIYDIAKLLQLSPATVSRALNDHPAINSNTKVIIASKAKEMGYRSNMFASNLRRQRTSTIGVIVPRLDSAFMSTVLAGMEKVANEANYNLIISQSLESFKKEVANTKTMFDSRVDGLLVSLASDTENLDHFNTFFRKGIPMILFDRVIEQKNCTNIVIDNVKAGYEATAHLIDQGCRRIMHITGSIKRNVYADRLKGYRLALMDHGLEGADELVKITNLTREDGVQAAADIQQMNSPPDGLFVASDFCAVSCMGALMQAGVSIPDDMAVVGFNDDPVAQVIQPSLTTIHYPGQEMGEIAAQSLINHLNGLLRINTTNTILLNYELIVRKSSQRHL